jgi:PAS domain S-box-containing protein
MTPQYFMDMTSQFFNPGPFMPHGGCYLWTTSLIALHAISDAAIGLAYYSIPFTLLYFVLKRKDLKFKWIFACFSLFVLACGTTHLMEIWNIWHANYWLSGGIKAVTALVSVPTAFLLIKLLPQALALPSTDDLRQARDELEIRVRERTAELEDTADKLKAEIFKHEAANNEIRRQAAFARSNPNPVLELSAVGEVMYYNAASMQMAKSFGQECPTQILPPNIAAIARDCLANNRPNLRLETVSKDRTISWSFFPVEENHVVHCYAGDITERKRAKVELNYERDLWRALLDNSPDKIYFKDTQSRFVKCSLAMARQFGVKSPEAMAGKTDFDFFDGSHARPAFEDEQQIIRTGRPMIDREEREEWRDGRVTWVSSTKLPWLDATGKIIGIMGVSRDITERKLAQENNARLATAVEQAAESVVITDLDAKILYVNPAFEKSTGYPRAEALGQNPRLLKSGRHDAAFYREVWDTLTRGEVWQGHFINKRKNGTFYEEEATISPVRDAAGQVVNYVAVKRDVTKEVQLENQVRQSQKMEGIGQLAGGVAHDFNNILAAQILQISLLESEAGLTHEVRDGLEHLRQGCERAADLVRQLLLFSRRQTVKMRDLDLNEVIIKVAKMLQRIIGEDIQLQLHLYPGDLLLHGDPGMIEQVLMNLCVNARDAMPAGGKIFLETTRAEFDAATVAANPKIRPGAFVCLSVTDTGGGIPQEILPRIFEPFFTTKDVGKGTGLGLATVFGIVQQHQGWINVYSEVGQGTTFQIYLPRLAQPANPMDTRTAPAAIVGGSETILLVEDESALRKMASHALIGLGYRVLEADDGAAALAVWKKHHTKINLLLTDMVMPGGLNGIELAAQLLAQAPALKVIYTSGYSTHLATEDLRLEEGVNFLSKPYALNRLTHIIRNSLDKPFTEAQLAAVLPKPPISS